MRASPAVLALVLAICPATAAFADDDMATRIGASREAIKSFAGALQKKLKSAMTDGGPTAAIEVCNVAAPEIAQTASAARGWSRAHEPEAAQIPTTPPMRGARRAA